MSQLPRDYVVSKFYEYGYRPSYHKIDNKYVCGCPLCLEGKSLHKKRRCAYLVNQDIIYCHNCGWSSKPLKWIIAAGKLTYEEVKKEIAEGDYYDSVDTLIDALEVPVQKTAPALPEDCINLYDYNQVKYFKENATVKQALRIIKQRRLFSAVNRPKALYVSLKDDVHRNRLIIPFFNADGISVDFYQSRKMFDFDEKEKYTSKLGGTRSIFGIDKVTSDNDTVFIFEGPIDAMFLKNGIAVGGINEGRALFNRYQQEQMNAELMFHQRIWVLDSQWLDKASRIKTEILLKAGERVFFWPYSIGSKYKDLNETCVCQGLNGIQGTFIERETLQNEEGLAKLADIRSKLGVNV